MLMEFIFNYFDDIFGKGFPYSPIIEFFYYCFLSFVGFSAFGAFIIAIILAYKDYSMINSTRFKQQLYKGLFGSITFSVILFIYNFWIQPRSNLEIRVALYNFQSTAPDSILNKIDKSLYKDNFTTMSISSLHSYIDSVDKSLLNEKKTFDSIISVIPDSIAQKLRLLNENPHTFNGQIISYKESLPNDLIRIIISGQIIAHGFKDKEIRLSKYKDEYFRRFIIPIEIILYFIACACLGFYYSDQKKFLLTMTGLFATSFFYWNVSSFDKIGLLNKSHFLVWLLIHLTILIAVVLIFYRLAIKKNKNYAT